MYTKVYSCIPLQVYTCSLDGQIALWDYKDGGLLKVLANVYLLTCVIQLYIIDYRR